MMVIPGFFPLRNRDTPMIVPVVPMLDTKWVTFPPVSRQISGPVASKCASGLSGLENWSSITPLPSATIRSARSRADSMPPDLGVSTSSAPNARMVWRRSSDWFSGMISTMR